MVSHRPDIPSHDDEGDATLSHPIQDTRRATQSRSRDTSSAEYWSGDIHCFYYPSESAGLRIMGGSV